MHKSVIVLLFLSGLFALLGVSNASAQSVQRTFVSGLGSNSNPCSRTAPCRTFTQAISQTVSGGEVVVLDSAGYAAFTITQAVSIIAPPGVYAGISVFSGDGITINAGASDSIALRGLTLNNQGSSGNGVTFNTGNTLHIEGCTFGGFSLGDGVFFNGPGNLEIKDSILRDYGYGIVITSASGTASATVDQV